MVQEEKKKNSWLKKNINNGLIFYCLMFAVPIVQFCIFYIGVNFNSILLAFKDYDALTGKYTFAAFDNFKQFFRNFGTGMPLTYALGNSLKLWFFGTIFGTTVTLFFSLYIYKKKFLFNTMRALLFMPSMLSGIVTAIVFTYIMGRGFTSLGMPDFLNTIDTQFDTIVVYNLWFGFGSGVLLYSGSMGQVSTETIEAAEVDGASQLRVFLSVILPGIFPTISTFMVTGIAGIFINQANIFSFFGQGADMKTQTIGYYLFVQVIAKNDSYATYPYAAASGLILTFVAAPLTLLTKWLLEKFGPSED